MAPNMPDKSRSSAFGAYLANLRAAKGLTLREVEEATGKEVSNAYLSQLEHGKISKPSPNILYSLASVYGVSYETLMEKAGYITGQQQRTGNEKHGKAATFAIDNLTADEEAALLDYLGYLRSKRPKKGEA
ncbi:helix-turn-helix domain-containing protein [Nostoc sp.]